MDISWSLYAIFIVTVAQIVDCDEPRPPPITLKCWRCNRRITTSLPRDDFCVQGNFPKEQRRLRSCKAGELCAVTLKTSKDGGKNIWRKCGDARQTSCHIDEEGSTVCQIFCDKHKCNTQPASSFANMSLSEAGKGMTKPSIPKTEPFRANVTIKSLESTGVSATEPFVENITTKATQSESVKLPTSPPEPALTSASARNETTTDSGGCNHHFTALDRILSLAVAMSICVLIS